MVVTQLVTNNMKWWPKKTEKQVQHHQIKSQIIVLKIFYMFASIFQWNTRKNTNNINKLCMQISSVLQWTLERTWQEVGLHLKAPTWPYSSNHFPWEVVSSEGIYFPVLDREHTMKLNIYDNLNDYTNSWQDQHQSFTGPYILPSK